MASITNAREISIQLEASGADVERAVQDELARIAQTAVRTMQRLAPKSRSQLAVSVQSTKVDDNTHDIGPTADHAPYVERGVKPGGKGLPRFFDPASASIVDWLRSHPKGGGVAKRAAAFASAAFRAANLALRDRYEGLALSIKARGVKAQPFVEPTLAQIEPEAIRRVGLAVRRALALRPDVGGAA